MPDIDLTREPAADQTTDPPGRRFVTWRSILVTVMLLAIVLMAALPPFLNVNRFKRRIVTSISTSLGRPVHLDSVSLVLLPFPGFKLDNFVVAEDPAFGSEPVIHANSVLAGLRLSSLWRRKVEFSKISLEEPSINLAHDAAGRWNIEGILLQAARIPAAPTAQASASANPRFPYIEATGARVNIKSSIEKLPFSLTEADFALWLPSPQQWRVRLVARPTRTDTNAFDTGVISLEGSLGNAEHFEQIPIEIAAEWKNAPLGEASKVLTGRDAGLRGDLRVNVSVTGTIGSSLVKSTIDLRNGRRAAFVPDRPLDLRGDCQATSANSFHAFHQIRCAWPPAPAASLGLAQTGRAPTLIALTGDIPDVHQYASASFEIGTPGLPASTILSWLRVASPRVPADLTATGDLAGSVSISMSAMSGSLSLRGETLAGGELGTVPFTPGDLTLTSVPTAGAAQHSARRAQPAAEAAQENSLRLTPVTLPLGGKDAAILEGRFDRNGYTLHLSGYVLASRLLALSTALPQFGDGLSNVVSPQPQLSAIESRSELPVRVDLTSSRPWLGPQTWSKVDSSIAPGPARRHRRVH